MGNTRHRRQTKNSKRRTRGRSVTARAIELRIEGRTLGAIGEILASEGLTENGKPMTPEGVRKALERGLAETMKLTEQSAEELRTVTLGRYDRMLEALAPKIAKGNPMAIDTARKIEADRAKLLGLNAPTKTQLTGANGGPIETKVSGPSFADLFASAKTASPAPSPSAAPDPALEATPPTE